MAWYILGKYINEHEIFLKKLQLLTKHDYIYVLNYSVYSVSLNSNVTLSLHFVILFQVLLIGHNIRKANNL